MENIHCIICEKSNSVPFITLSDRLTHNAQTFQLVKCECNFVYLNPRPDSKQISSYYQSAKYDPHNTINKDMWIKMYRFIQQLTMRWKYNKIVSIKPSGRVLDIGGGNGEFAFFMASKGWDVVLQDTISEVVDRNIYKNFESVKDLHILKDDQKFDVITLWHSLEHIHDIKNIFDYISILLTDSGILMIAVPNLYAPERNFYKHNWAPYDAPRHLYHFSLDKLNELCKQNGYEIIQKYSLYQDLPYNVLLSAPNYYPLQLIKAIFVICCSFLYNICAGPDYASSFLIICRKKI
mgnify:CR=1 FL=1